MYGHIRLWVNPVRLRKPCVYITIFTCTGVAFDVQSETPAVEGDQQAPPKIRCGEFTHMYRAYH